MRAELLQVCLQTFYNPPVSQISFFLAIDFDVGFAIKEKIIPRAVLYFTGEILEDDEDFEDIDSDETEEEDDD